MTLADVMVSRTKIPDDMAIGDELGKGANNKVLRCSWKDTRCVLRVPRRRSDTQQRGSAIWELRHTLRASELKVGPMVLHAWYARHATREWPSGLYIVMERYDDDLETVLCESTDAQDDMIKNRDRIGRAITDCVATLAQERIFVYDLKPSNVVIRIADENIDVRIIDFGRDFCEWSGCLTDPSRNTPHVDMLIRSIDTGDDDKRIVHILFATMMIILSSTTTSTLYDSREHHRMDASTRASVHPLLEITKRLLSSMQGRHVSLVRNMLRMDEVRGVLRHYHGRRNSGTHRTLAFASGVECVGAFSVNV